MPLYFAYGSNMGEAALRSRCPRARRIGNARLARHRFVLMGNGYASIKRAPRSDVHGVLYELALSDIGPLDLYEEVARGVYTKAIQPVIRDTGRDSRAFQACQALVYIGTDETEGGRPPRGYMEAIVEAARAVALPGPYVAMLDSVLSGVASKTPRPAAP